MELATRDSIKWSHQGYLRHLTIHEQRRITYYGHVINNNELIISKIYKKGNILQKMQHQSGFWVSVWRNVHVVAAMLTVPHRNWCKAACVMQSESNWNLLTYTWIIVIPKKTICGSQMRSFVKTGLGIILGRNNLWILKFATYSGLQTRLKITILGANWQLFRLERIAKCLIFYFVYTINIKLSITDL